MILAIQNATKVVDSHDSTNDIKLLRREAFILANTDILDNNSSKTQNTSASEHSSKDNEDNFLQDKLPDMLENAKKTGKDISQVLNENNILKTPLELLPT